MPSNFRSKSQSGPVKRSWVRVAAMGSSHSGMDIVCILNLQACLMAQLTLFESTDTILTDDERGRVSYLARFVDTQTAGEWFASLRAAVAWRSERRLM